MSNDIQQTKDNHYVPQFYLKQFLNNDGFLQCYDLQKKQYFSSNRPKEICKRKNLYLIKNKISSLDKALLWMFLGNIDNEDKDFCRHLIEMLNGTVSNLISIKVNNNQVQEKINKCLLSTLNETETSRKIETLFTFIENDFQIFFNEIIKNKSISVSDFSTTDIKTYLYIKILKYVYQDLFNSLKYTLKSENVKKCELPKLNLLEHSKENLPIIDIMHYVLSQYFRTKRIVNGVKHNFKKYESQIQKNINSNVSDEKFDTDNITFLYLIIKPILLLNDMLKNDFYPILLKNCTYTPFLISDNPSINTYADKNKKKYNVDELEIYFPLTSNLALLLTKNKNIVNEIEDVNVIDEYNLKIIKNAERYIFANDKVILKKYDNYYSEIF